MKKIISVILATALFLAMLPAGYASAEDTATYPGNIEVYTYKLGPGYEFTVGNNSDLKENANAATYVNTNGLWSYRMKTANNFYFEKTGALSRIKVTASEDKYCAVEINVPKAGKYDVKLLNVLFGTKKYDDELKLNTYACLNVEFYVLNGELTNSQIESKLSSAAPIGTFDVEADNWDGTSTLSEQAETKDIGSCYFEKGKNVIVYKRDPLTSGTWFYIQGIVLDGSGNASSEAAATSTIMTVLPGGIDSMKVGEKTYIVSSKIAWASGGETAGGGIALTDLFGTDVTTTDGASLTLTSSDTDVIEVDEAANSITAVAPGTATVTATVTYDGLTKTTEFDITVPDIEADKTITIAVDDDGDGVAAVDSSMAVGASYTVTAADRSSENLEFRGWVRGSADNGTWVSNENPYTFTVTTNTFLTAVYSAAATAENPVTEYYNWNGAYLGTEEKEPTLTGYSFKDWVTTKVSDILSRAVAQYTVESAEYTVTTDNSFDISVEGGKYVYDAKVTCEAEEAVYWYRDGKCVDYGETYSFNVWGNTKITTSATGSTGAKVILDEVTKTTGTTEKSYMIEYDTGDKALVEVGILFGDGFTPTIEKCSEKMTSQRNDAHGQFTATSAHSYARGFLIYNDGDTYRVIYAD